ncbi:MAG: hypothetical protein JST92_24420, partial [Deltaproteobacteria bacterium]|nr:hypothetical protein [Deltaproteobacteria bacterium]
ARLAPEGLPWLPLAVDWRTDPPQGAWWAQRRLPDRATFADRLASTKIDYVLLRHTDAGAWPPQRDLLRDIAGAHSVFTDEDTELWSLGR